MLSKRSENWLYANFPRMSNEELAEELTKKTYEDNERVIERLKVERDNAATLTQRKLLSSRIRTLQKFKGFSVDYVKHFASRIGCGRKDPVVISRQNRRSAIKGHHSRMMKCAVDISTPYEWFRTFNPKETRVGRCKDEHSFVVVQHSMHNWNRSEGRKVGIYLVGQFYKKDLLIKAYAQVVI